MKRNFFQLIPKAELEEDPLFFLKDYFGMPDIPCDIYEALICVYRISRHDNPLLRWQKMHKHMFNHHLVNVLKRRSLLSSHKNYDLKRNKRKYKHLCFGEISRQWKLDPKLSSVVSGIIDSLIYRDPFFFKRNANRLRKEKHLKKMDKINKRLAHTTVKESDKKNTAVLWNPFKGILCSAIISDILAEGGNAVVFDDSDHYKNLCESVGGQYITKDNFSLIGIDFFKFLPEKSTDQSEQYWDLVWAFITSLILMATDDELCDSDRDMVKLALVSVWREKGQGAKLLDVIKNLEEQEDDTASKIALGLTKFDKRYNGFFKNSPANFFKTKLTVVNLKGLDNPLLHTVITSLLMAVSHHQKEGRCSNPFLVLFEDTLLPDPFPTFENVITTFSQSARLQRISLGKVSSQIENITELGLGEGSERSSSLYRSVHYSSLFDMAFWRNSSWHVFFEGRYRGIDFIEKTRRLLTKRNVQTLFLLSGPQSIAIRGETQDLKRYTFKIKGEDYATAA